MFIAPEQLSAVEISGRYTNLLFQTENSLNQQQLTDLNRLRLTGEGSFKRFTWEISYDHEILYGDLIRDPQYQLFSRLPERTYVDASAYIHRGKSVDWKHSFYRGWLQYEQESVSVTIGRQRVAWGSGRIWNPTDRFNPVAPTAIEPDQKLGVDAINAVWRYGGFGSVQLIAAPGKAAHNLSRKVAGRWQDTFGEFDVAVMGGRFGDERLMGLDLTGNLGDGGGRLEVVHSASGLEGTYTQLSTGYDYTLTNELFQDGLYLALEYFYNGAAPDSPLVRAGGSQKDRLQSLSRSLWGGQLGYDLTSLWRLDFLLLADLNHRSFFYAPRVVWSVTENLDLSMVAQIVQEGSVIGSGGEFSGTKNIYVMQLDWYF
ncbi:MAG: hypothetical protein R8K54_07685 [Mariprofundaceae bacterium]